MTMFDTEDRLMAAFDSVLENSELWLGLPGRRTITLKEVAGIHGCVDRMMVSLPSGVRPVKTRSNLLCQETCCRIVVALCGKQPKSVNRLAIETARSHGTVRYWLARMEQEDLVQAIASRGYVRGPKANLPNFEIWCFEGKLRNWKRAVYQATRYRAFAHRSFVVMPERYVRSAEAQLHIFRLSRVGLLALGEDGNLRVIMRPRLKRPRSPVMFTMAKARALSSIT